jgi:hypothetical protein
LKTIDRGNAVVLNVLPQNIQALPTTSNLARLAPVPFVVNEAGTVDRTIAAISCLTHA